MIDIHSHILPGLDDGAKSLEHSLKMARLAVADGIRIMVATPHLFKNRVLDFKQVNDKKTVLSQVELLQSKLFGEDIDLKLLPGCDFPLSLEALELLESGQALTINDSHRYLLLELPDASIPPAVDHICFRLQSRGLTPIITHPERHFLIQEMPHKLRRLLDLGCLAQLTGSSLTGGFGRAIRKFSRKLIKSGYVHVLASDAHNTSGRPPLLREAAAELAGLVGQSRAHDMIFTFPEKIISGESF